MLKMKIVSRGGVFLPWLFFLHQVGLFIPPGFYRHEKRYVVPFMISTVALFIAGGLFGFKIAFPAALDFLIGYSVQFKPMITIGEYTDLFPTILLALVPIFHLPILLSFLLLIPLLS